MVITSCIPEGGWDKRELGWFDIPASFVISPNSLMVFLNNMIIKAHTLTANQHDTVTHWTRAKGEHTEINNDLFENENIRSVNKNLLGIEWKWHIQLLWCVTHCFKLVNWVMQSMQICNKECDWKNKAQLNTKETVHPTHTLSPFNLWMGSLEQKIRLTHHKHSFGLLVHLSRVHLVSISMSGLKVHSSSMPKKASVLA